VPTVRPAGPNPPPPPLPRSDLPTLASSEGGRPSAFRTGVAAFLGVAIGALVTFAALAVSGRLEQNVTPSASSQLVTSATTAPPRTVTITPRENIGRVSAVAAKALPSIVTVLVAAEDRQVGDLPLGSGSGIVLDRRGHVVTNHHVIDGASSIRLVFSNGRTYRAELVGSDALTDLAVLSTGAADVVPIKQASGDDPQVGDTAVAVGNPLGLDGPPSVTSGIVSAVNRTLEVEPGENLYGLIQTDAPITRGSSGGALLNGQGELIGVTTAIGVTDVGAEGLGFAVPVSSVVSIAGELIAQGAIEHAYLGIQGQTEFLPEEDGAEVPSGARVAQLEADSALAAGGGQIDDVIVTLGGSPVTSIDNLVSMLRSYRAGETVEVGLLRNGRPVQIEVTLDRNPASG
jgi:S1-C subfamily serine protease